jgi:signal transduction histidine kinase
VRERLARRIDALLAAVTLAGGAVDFAIVAPTAGRAVPLVAFWVALAALMLVRTRLPIGFALGSAAVACAGTLAVPGLGLSEWGVGLLLLSTFTVALCEPEPRVWYALGACTVAWLAGAAAIDARDAVGYAFALIMVGIGGAAGRTLRTRHLLSVELAARSDRLAADREARARLAVADERSRIARQLHAVVTERVSEMVVQAEAVGRLLDQDADAAPEMSAIEDGGRAALAEMRTILGVLRAPEQDAPLAPQPGAGQIHLPVERAREAGRPVSLQVEGDPRPLPPAVDLAVYRLVEEALAPSAPDPAGVTLRFEDIGVRLEVWGRPDGISWPTVEMRERVTLCEGHVAVEPNAARGAVLVADLPHAFGRVPLAAA